MSELRVPLTGEPPVLTIPMTEMELVQLHSAIERRLSDETNEPVELHGIWDDKLAMIVRLVRRD